MRSRTMPFARRLPGLTALAVAVVLTGCMRVDRTLVVRGDGSGSYTLAIGFREPTPNDPSSISPNVVTPMEAFGARVQQTGGSYRRSEDQGYAYWTYTRPFSSVAQGDALLQDDPHPYDPTHAPLLYHDALQLTQEKGLFDTRLHVTGVISLADPFGKATNWQDATEMLAISMPDGIISSQGGARVGDTVTYTIHYNQSAAIDVVGRSSASGGTALPLVFVGGAVGFGMLAVALLVVGIGLLRRAGRQQQRMAVVGPARESDATWPGR